MVVGPEMAVETVAVVAVEDVVEVDQEVEHVGQVAWCSGNAGCGCMNAASSWHAFAHMGWCGQGAQQPFAIVHKQPCPLSLGSDGR